MDSEQLAALAADACDDRKATDIRMIRVDEYRAWPIGL